MNRGEARGVRKLRLLLSSEGVGGRSGLDRGGGFECELRLRWKCMSLEAEEGRLTQWQQKVHTKNKDKKCWRSKETNSDELS